MASIEKRDSRFRVLIRRNKTNISATFSDETTAKLFAAYKEDLIEKMAQFDVPVADLMTLRDCSVLKIADMKKKACSHRSISDVEQSVSNDFSAFCDMPMSSLTYDLILNKAILMLDQIVRKGGSKHSNSGDHRQQNPVTVLKKMRVLGSIISYGISLGANIDNVVPRVTSYLEKSVIKSSQKPDRKKADS